MFFQTTAILLPAQLLQKTGIFIAFNKYLIVKFSFNLTVFVMSFK